MPGIRGAGREFDGPGSSSQLPGIPGDGISGDGMPGKAPAGVEMPIMVLLTIGLDRKGSNNNNRAHFCLILMLLGPES